MAKGVTTEQMAEIDRKAQEEYGIAQVDLMENAGRSVAEEILSDFGSLREEKVAVLCGKGNNGGDGFVIARHLAEKEPQCLGVYITDPEGVRKGSALDNLQLIRGKKIDIRSMNEFVQEEESFTLVIDAIFGTGFKGELTEELKRIAKKVTSSSARVYAVDIPSGLNSTTGKASESSFKADKTVTFGLPKTGFYLEDGPALCGQIIVKDIGFPKVLLEEYL
ncbi:MAG: NAD(P)H-hydrate epimerase [Candidatus Omnitrophota bacterium]